MQGRISVYSYNFCILMSSRVVCRTGLKSKIKIFAMYSHTPERITEWRFYIYVIFKPTISDKKWNENIILWRLQWNVEIRHKRPLDVANSSPVLCSILTIVNGNISKKSFRNCMKTIVSNSVNIFRKLSVKFLFLLRCT